MIPEEIRKRIEARKKNTYHVGDYDEYADGIVVGLSYALGIIDEVEKEHPVPADLEAEIDKEVKKLRTTPCYDELRDFARHFHAAGMLAERERLMKEAVEGEVVSDLKNVNHVRTMSKIPDTLYFGEKVSVIIIKKEK